MPTLIPHLTVSNAAAAIDFYKQALGAVELYRMSAPDGKRLIHAALTIGDSTLFLADEFPEWANPDASKSPQTLGGTAITIHVNSPDVDKTFATAIAVGGVVTMPVADMFWGDRYGQFRDPFGHVWSVSTTFKKMTRGEMLEAAKAAFSKPPEHKC